MGKTRPVKAVDIGSRLRQARVAAGITQETLGRRSGVTRAAAALWEATGEIKVQNLALAASILDADLNWLVTGNGQSNGVGKKNGHAPPKALGVIPEMKRAIGTAGPAHLHTTADWWRVNPSALETLGVHVDNVQIYRVDTSLMEPAIRPGSYVMIDYSQTALRDGQVYAIDTGIALALRRVFVTDRKTVELSFDAEPKQRTRLPLKNFKPAGRVVAQLLARL